MSIEQIIAKLKEEEKKEVLPIKENEFSRIAYLIENNSTSSEQELEEILNLEQTEIISREFKNIQSFNLVKREPGKNLSFNPFYMAREVKKLPIVMKISKYLEPISWIVYYCNSKNDLLYAIIIQKMGEIDNLREMVEKYSIESIAKYSIIKRIYEYSASILKNTSF